MIIPDRETLIHRYNELRKTHEYRDLPPLDIVSGQGIASDLEFVQANIDHDGIISEGKEFAHDVSEHIIFLLKRARLGSKKFGEIKEEMIMRYQKYLDKIERAKNSLGENLPIFETLLGAYVDSLTNAIDGRESVEKTFVNFTSILNFPLWQAYFRNRYSDPEKGPIFSEDEIRALLPLIEHA
jgi:hypothetical protein